MLIECIICLSGGLLWCIILFCFSVAKLTILYMLYTDDC